MALTFSNDVLRQPRHSRQVSEAKSNASVNAAVEKEIKSLGAAKRDIKYLIKIFWSEAEAITPAVANMKYLMDISHGYRSNLIIVIVGLHVPISLASLSFRVPTNSEANADTLEVPFRHEPYRCRAFSVHSKREVVS